MITVTPWMLQHPMRIGTLTLLLACLANPSPASPGSAAPTFTARPEAIRYVSPSPGAQLVRPQTGIIVRLDRSRDLSRTVLEQALNVTGSATGEHHGTIRLAADGRTLLFDPDRDFGWGERVTVRISPALYGAAGRAEGVPEFAFDITATPPPAVPSSVRLEYGADPAAVAVAPRKRSGAPTLLDSLPPDFPSITIHNYGATAPGYLYLASLSFAGVGTPHLLILENDGTPAFYRAMSASCLDFKLQPNGQTTYFDQATDKFYAMNGEYAIVDSFVCGNGYPTDVHELQLYPDGHSLLMSYDPQSVDMSTVVPGGNPNAVVIGLVIQELDQNKDVVFQWRSWDHYEITDATHTNLLAATIDYAHGNAIELDPDGDLMISCRHMDEITKIDRETGAMVWRWGGKHNEFEFVGDTLQFSYQHGIRRLQNGNVILHDNGNFHSPQYSRAVEYALDEVNKTATNVWQYRNTPDTYGAAMGFAQRLDNGNTMISWGTGKPDMIEVTPAGEKVLELELPELVATYRGFRQPLSNQVAVPPGSAPSRLAFSEAFPNPTRARTQFRLTLQTPAQVSLEVFDLAGRLVSRPIDGVRFEPGEHRLKADLTGQGPGLYFCRVSAGDVSETRKVVVGR